MPLPHDLAPPDLALTAVQSLDDAVASGDATDPMWIAAHAETVRLWIDRLPILTGDAIPAAVRVADSPDASRSPARQIIRRALVKLATDEDETAVVLASDAVAAARVAGSMDDLIEAHLVMAKAAIPGNTAASMGAAYAALRNARNATVPPAVLAEACVQMARALIAVDLHDEADVLHAEAEEVLRPWLTERPLSVLYPYLILARDRFGFEDDRALPVCSEVLAVLEPLAVRYPRQFLVDHIRWQLRQSRTQGTFNATHRREVFLALLASLSAHPADQLQVLGDIALEMFLEAGQERSAHVVVSRVAPSVDAMIAALDRALVRPADPISVMDIRGDLVRIKVTLLTARSLGSTNYAPFIVDAVRLAPTDQPHRPETQMMWFNLCILLKSLCARPMPRLAQFAEHVQGLTDQRHAVPFRAAHLGELDWVKGDPREAEIARWLRVDRLSKDMLESLKRLSLQAMAAPD